MSHDSWKAFVDEIRTRSPSIDVVHESAKEDRPGWYYSPFRKERTASLQVYGTAEQGWYDHGAKVGGDVFRYVQERDRCTFRQAVDTLAARLGMTYNAEDKHLDEEIAKYHEGRQVLELQTKLVYLAHACLTSKVRDHLIENVGLSEETIVLSKIGFCPEAFFAMARDEGYEAEALLKTGYFMKAGGEVHCVFAGRILFPYWTKGHSPYAIGRQFEPCPLPVYWSKNPWDKAKYRKLVVQSEKHPYVSMFVANDTIFGEDDIRRARDYCVFTEGMTDALSLQQLGEPVGSFITTKPRNEDFPKLLAITKHIKTIYICNDNDVLPDGTRPGIKGALSMAAALFADKRDVRLCELPKPAGVAKIDVNEFVRKLGDPVANEWDPAKEAWARVKATAKPFPVFMMDTIPDSIGGDALEAALEPVIKIYPDMSDVAREDMIVRVVKRFKLSKKLVKKLLGRDIIASIMAQAAAVAPPMTSFSSDTDQRPAASTSFSTTGQTVATPGVEAPAGALKTMSEGAAAVVVDPFALAPEERGPAPHLRLVPPTGGGGSAPPPGLVRKKRVKGEVTDDIGCYSTNHKDLPSEQISSFSLVLKQFVSPLPDDPVRTSKSSASKLMVCDVIFEEGDRLTDITFPRNAWSGRKHLLEALSDISPRLQWMGEDHNIQFIQRGLSKLNVPSTNGCSIIGYAKTPEGEPRFVTPQGTISKDGWMDKPDVVYMNSGGSLARKVNFQRVSQDETCRLAKEILPLLFKMNTAAVIVPILGHCFASPYRTQFVSKMGHFPVLAVAGTRGSGKTSVITRIFWRLQGVDKEQEEPYSVTQTQHATLKAISSTNSIWTPFDEFKPSDMGKNNVERFCRTVRCTYSGANEDKGRPDQGVNSYSLSSSLVVIGEAHVDDGDPALSERIVPVHPGKNYVEKNVEAKKAFRELSELPMHLLAPSFAQWVLNHPLNDYFAVAEKEVAAFLDRKLATDAPNRCRDNMIAVVVGVNAFKAWAESLGVVLPKNYDEYVDDGILAMIANILNGTTPGSIKDTVDTWIEDLSTMAGNGDLKLGHHYIVKPKPGAKDGALNSDLVLFHIPTCLSMYQQWTRSRGREDVTHGAVSLTRMFAEKKDSEGSYVIEVKRFARFPSGTLYRCVEIDQSKISEAMSAFTKFPSYTPKPTHVPKDDD